MIRPGMNTFEIIVDRWREVPAIPQNGFFGMTELSARGRFWQMAGTGEETREALQAHVEDVLAMSTTPQHAATIGRE